MENNTIDLTKVKPYGDTLNDGKVQLSFTLPVPGGAEAEEAAKKLAEKMGLKDPGVAHSQDLGIGYTFFVVYGSCMHDVNYEEIEVPKVDNDVMDKYAIEAFIDENIKRDVVIIGASSGTDAHTVGIDAIMNMKGYNGHYGLERYKHMEAINMGSQVPNEELLARAIEENADAIIISQTVTQKDVHIKNLTEFIELIEAEGLRDKFVVCCGGPRIDHELAKELGYDAGFGRNTYAEDVASFVVNQVVDRDLITK